MDSPTALNWLWNVSLRTVSDFLKWNPFYAKLKGQYVAWSYKKKKRKEIKANKKAIYKEPKDKRWLETVDINSLDHSSKKSILQAEISRA